MTKRIDIDKDGLYRLYIEELRNYGDIARIMEVGKHTIERRIKEYGFKRTKEQIIKSREKTCIKKYGYTTNLKSDDIKEKTKKTCLKKYGVEYTSQSEIVKNKRRKTFIEKYGVDNPLKNKEVQDKIKKTMLERYGVENPTQNKIIQNRTKKTMLEKYGVEHPLQNRDIVSNIVKRQKNVKSEIDDSRFDSRYEKVVYDYCISNNISIERNVPIEYIYKNKKKITFIDFKIGDYLIECKGKHLLMGCFDYDERNVPMEIKLEVYRQNSVIIVTSKDSKYIIDKFNNDHINNAQLVLLDIKVFEDKNTKWEIIKEIINQSKKEI